MKLKNKIIFLTGVGKGIGLSMLEKVISEGAFVYGITKSKKDIKKIKFINCKIFAGNVTNIKLIEKIFKQSLQDKKPINCIINNAGVRLRKSFLNTHNHDLKRVFDINFFSIFKISQIFIEFCLKNKIKGNILNISSIVSDLGFSELSAYGAAKSALNSLTKSLAAEFSHLGFRFNAIKPGFVKTSYFENFKKNNQKLLKWTIQRTPMKRWGDSLEIANIASFLISDDASYINGETINVDGGWSNT